MNEDTMSGYDPSESPAIQHLAMTVVPSLDESFGDLDRINVIAPERDWQPIPGVLMSVRVGVLRATYKHLRATKDA